MGVIATALLPATAGASLTLLKVNPSDPATFVGTGGYSADGLGQQGTVGGVVSAEVPAGSTVVQAYLYGTYYSVVDPSVVQRTIDFDGTLVETQKISDVNTYEATTRANVTSQVALKVGSGGGITDFAINNDPANLDGVALVVIYSNPASPTTTIAVLDGSASSGGDAATFTFLAPLDLTAPGFSATMSLGSGFSFQAFTEGHECGTEAPQSSLVTVNGQRLSSCAGHYDDGITVSGALITVGGVGDDLFNPSDPFQLPADGQLPRVEDDELYNLGPLLTQGAASATINSFNPSADDNLFLSVISIAQDATVTQAEICDNGVDDDDDGLTDGADPDCGPPPATPTCFGQTATIYRGSGYLGTNTTKANDPMIIVGTSGNDVIYTANGNDVIDGAGGDDVICGVGGNDKIRGGAGNDQIFGSQGDDDLGGQAGNDEILGGPGNDRLNGGDGNDHLKGGDGDDIVNGGDGDDSVNGGLNDDVLAGNDGTDVCTGGGGNDHVTANSGCETFTFATVSNNTAATTAAADRKVVAAAEAEGASWTDGAAVNPTSEANPAILMPRTESAGTPGRSGSDDVAGGNVTAGGDR